ncbi:MAG: hypothetical protein LBS91_08050 [Clostridiales Family XIII bacterium]|nr:hypothetical protein [Clostridiales Family XIII bacterium]
MLVLSKAQEISKLLALKATKSINKKDFANQVAGILATPYYPYDGGIDPFSEIELLRQLLAQRVITQNDMNVQTQILRSMAGGAAGASQSAQPSQTPPPAPQMGGIPQQNYYGTANPKKPVAKRPWFWIVIVVIIIIIIIAAASSGGDGGSSPSTGGANGTNAIAEKTTPLSDAEIPGMLSDADKFKGRTVDRLPGVVFNVINQEAGDYEYQCWADDEHNQHFIIISETDLGLSTDIFGGSNIFVTGIIRGAYASENYFGAELSAAVIEVSSIEKSETSVFNLANYTIEVNQTQEQFGISVTLEKVELADKSTRVFIKIFNGTSGKIQVYGWGSYIKQGSTQYDQSDISYEEDTVKTELNSGIETEGCLSFEALGSLNDFTINIDVSSDDYDLWDKLQPFEFSIILA